MAFKQKKVSLTKIYVCLELEAKRKLAEELKRKEQEENNTFKPNLNRKRKATECQMSTSSSQAYFKYLTKQENARALRDEIKIKEKKVFLDGSKWNPNLTNPATPRLAYID
jgi:hypothetical protein